MKYRLMRAKDVKSVFLLGEKDFGSKSEYSWDWSIKKIRKYLKRPFGFGIVCLDKDNVVGFVLAENNYSSQKPNVAWLTYIFVDENHRHMKVGSSLLSLVSEKLSSIGKTELITDIYLDNSQSIAFFGSSEFRIKERWAILSKKLAL
jgi:predicted N-acetyltransferase YhbS